jgi:hypothetical protein
MGASKNVTKTPSWPKLSPYFQSMGNHAAASQMPTVANLLVRSGRSGSTEAREATWSLILPMILPGRAE